MSNTAICPICQSYVIPDPTASIMRRHVDSSIEYYHPGCLDRAIKAAGGKRAAPTADPIAGLVEVRLTVDRMRHQIVQALPTMLGQIEASIEHELKRAVDGFCWEAEVVKAANVVLAEMVRMQVRDTIHADEAIRKIVTDELSRNVR